jgi:hypothetical protein
MMDSDGSWIKGSNSQLDPTNTPVGYAWSFVNMLNVSGVPTCRPGYRCIAKLPPGKIQGAAIFRPTDGLEQIIVAVGGVIWVSVFPFTKFEFLNNVLFSPSAKRVFFTQTTQSNQRLTPDELISAIEVITPKQVMMMQDGGFTAPAYYDGSNHDHLRDFKFETPAGGVMAWIGDRLWVSHRNKLVASDIGNPFSFRENLYLGGTDGLYFQRDIVAMTPTPSLEFPQLLVLTDEDASLVQASIRDRAAWATTDGFQREVLQVGCLSDLAVVSHFGRLVWWCPAGVVFFDPATSRGWTSRTPVRDNEMMVSKTHISDDVSNAAIGVFGQWLLISLPVEDSYNKQTWVLNGASYESINDEGGPTWSGYWIGTRPVAWLSGTIAGQQRIYHVSFDEDGENRLWEAFTPDRLDNGCPITWALITRGMFGASSQVQKPPGYLIRFNFAEISLVAMDEDVDCGVFVAPGVRGSYRQISGQTFRASKGSLDYRLELTADSQIFALKAQSRRFQTQDLQTLPNIDGAAACPIEDENGDGVEESFQLLIVGQGPATLQGIRCWANDQGDERNDASAQACEDETEFKGLRFDGIGFEDESLEKLIEELTVVLLPTYTANKTVSITSDPYTVVGTGSATSIISQRAADRVANIVATQQAEAEMAALQPPIFSEGLVNGETE